MLHFKYVKTAIFLERTIQNYSYLFMLYNELNLLFNEKFVSEINHNKYIIHYVMSILINLDTFIQFLLIMSHINAYHVRKLRIFFHSCKPIKKR